MLDAYIIDAIRREEERERAQREGSRRIWLELPRPEPARPEMEAPRSERYDWNPYEDNEPDRGPVVIPLYPNEPTEDAA